ncbi:protein [Lentinula edodes]|uniref:Protein n=1 Tax=Lentinula edodes TaxID=5353 RepID=A0A1Q3DYS8_LENED|nr:protein [Lentinula edodes]
MRANPGGIYDRLAKSFTEMGAIALANAEINQDFFPHNFGESWSMNYSYRDCDSALFSANVFGEIVGQAHGTFIGAQGNHYAGKDPSNPTVLDDYTKTKCTIVLACPSFATPPITNLFYNQLCTLDSVRDEDKKGEIRSGLSVDAKEIAKSIRTGGDLDAIILTGPALYSVLKKGKPNGKDNNLSATSPPRRALKKRSLAAASNDDLPLLQVTSETPLPTAEKHLVWPTAEEIFVGAEYDHRLMPDFGGPVFAFEKAKLIQPDWRDVNGDLIPPWLNHKLLRPGTLVVANISIQVYVMISKSGDGMVRKVLPVFFVILLGFDRTFDFVQIYHAVLNSLWVVGGSDVLITPPVPLLHRSSLPKQNTSQTAAALALAALNFNVEQSTGASSSLAFSDTPGSDSTVDSDNLDAACDHEVHRSAKDGGLEAANVEGRPSPKKKLRK